MGADSIAALRGRYLIFRLADRTYGIPIASVEEIVPMAELSILPNAPSFLAGLLDIGRQLVAVVSLRRLLGMPAGQRSLYTPIVILKSMPLALEVDGLTRIVEISGDDLIPIADGQSLNNFATGVARLDGNTVVLLSPDEILLEQEQRSVAELVELAQQRLSQIEPVSA